MEPGQPIAAPPAAPPPPPEAPAADRVDIMVGGKPATVPRADLQAALDAGATVPEPVDNTASSLLGSIQAWSAGAQDIGTAGMLPALSYRGLHAVDSALGTDLGARYKSGKEKMEREHGLAYAAGGVGGLVAEAFVPGLQGETAGGAAGASRGLFAAMAKDAASQAGQQIAYNVGKQVSEDALGDADTNAEKLFAAADPRQKDVLFAAGLGAAGSAAGHGLGALVKSFRGPVSGAAADAVVGVRGAGKAFAEEAARTEKAVDAMRRTGMSADDAAAHVAAVDNAVKSGLPNSVEAEIAKASPGARDVMRAHAESLMEGALSRAEERAKLAHDLKPTFDDAFGAKADLDVQHFAERTGNMREFADPSKFDGALDAVGRMTGEIDKVTESIGALADKGGAAGPLRDMQKAADEMRRVMGRVGTPTTEAAAKAAIVELNDAANRAKRLADKLGKMGQSPYGLPYGAQQIRELGDTLRPMLEDSQAWGKIGDAHADINRAFSGEGSYKAVQMMGREFGTVLETPGGMPKVELDPAKLESYLAKVGKENQTYTSDQAIGAFLEHVENRVAVSRKYGLGDEAALAKAEAATKKIRDSLKRAQEKAITLNKLDAALESASNDHAGSALGGVIGGVAGTALGGMFGTGVGHVAGKAIGHAVDLYKSPLKRVELLMKLERTRNAFDGELLGGLKRFFGAEPSAARAAPRPRANLVNEVQQVKQLAANPQRLTDRGAAIIGSDMQTHAPQHAAALGGVLVRAVSFLASQAPQGRASAPILPGVGKPPEVRYPDADLARYARASDAVHDPVQVIEDAKHGSLSREGVTALRVVYPRLYAELQAHVMDQLADMHDRGELDRMPADQRRLLGILLEVPTTVDLQPGYIADVQASKAMQPAQKPGAPPQGGSKRPIKLNSSQFQTEDERITSGGSVR